MQMEGTFFTQNAHPKSHDHGNIKPKHSLAKVQWEETTCHLNGHANLKDMGMNTHPSPSVFA